MANVKNFTYSTVAVAPSPATSGTSLTVSSGEGALFVAGRPAVIYPSGEAPLSTNAEIVTVSNVVGDVLTIVREQESTSARTVIVGDQIAQVLTAAEYNALEADIAALESGKLDTTAQAADVNPAGTAIAAALAAKLSTSGTAADVNPAGTSIAAALAGKLATSGTAADVNPAGTSIAAALAGKLATSGTAADVNPNGTSIAAALAGKLGTSATAADVNPNGTSIASALAGKTPASVVPGTLPNAGQLLIGNAGNTAYAPVTMSGDLTIAANGVSTLATVNGNVGSFGSATQVVGLTVNAKGQVTAASNITVTPAIGSVTGLGANVATALASNVGSAGAVVTNGGALGTPSSGTLTNCTGLPIAGGGTNASTVLGAQQNLNQLTFNDQTTSYTLALADIAKCVRLNNANATVLTVPNNSTVAFPNGSQILCAQIGAGQVTVSGGTGVTVNSRGSALKSAGQWAQWTLAKDGTDTWMMSGDITT